MLKKLLIIFLVILLIGWFIYSCGRGVKEAMVDTTPPTVLTTSPTNGATGVAVNTNILVTFDEAMDSSTIVASPVFLISLPGRGYFVDRNITYDSATYTATIDPPLDFPYNTTITMTVAATVKDLAGNQMVSPYTWSFTTAATTSAIWSPQTSGRDASLNSVFFIDSNTGWAVGDRGTILRYSP